MDTGLRKYIINSEREIINSTSQGKNYELCEVFIFRHPKFV